MARALGSGDAPPMHERIGVAGSLATLLTMGVPLITVGSAALLSRTLAVSAELRVVATIAAGLLALALYPLYGMFIYCSFTRVRP